MRAEILIPTYNHSAYLPDAIASAARTGLPVTTIDDASTDDTQAVLDRLSKKWSFKRLHNERNLQQWGSLNRAIEESDSNLFIVLNADDVLLPWAADTILKLWQAYPDIRMLGANYTPFKDPRAVSAASSYPDQMAQLPVPEIYTPDRVLTFNHPDDLNMGISSLSFVRSAWETAGKFRTRTERICFWDDRDFELRVAALFPVAVIHEPLMMYRLGSSTWLETAYR